MGKLTNNQIVEEYQKTAFIKKTLEYISRSSYEETDYLKDVEQDIYIQLLMMDEDKLNELYYKKQLNYWVTRIIINQIRSKTSPTFSKYRKLSYYSDDLGEIRDMINKDTDKDNEYNYMEGKTTGDAFR